VNYLSESESRGLYPIHFLCLVPFLTPLPASSLPFSTCSSPHRLLFPFYLSLPFPALHLLHLLPHIHLGGLEKRCKLCLFPRHPSHSPPALPLTYFSPFPYLSHSLSSSCSIPSPQIHLGSLGKGCKHPQWIRAEPGYQMHFDGRTTEIRKQKSVTKSVFQSLRQGGP